MILVHWLRVLRQHPRPGRLAAARLLKWSGLSHLLTMQFDGYRLRVYPSNVTLNLWIDPGSRTHSLALFRDYCRRGDVVVDVGANIGEVSVIMSQQVGSDGRVFAFEPLPRVFGYLRGNLALNGCTNVTTRNAALGTVPGTVMITDDRRDDMNRLVAEGGTPVECSTIDRELAGTGSVALIKIDVEGTELAVLKGARETLARTACVNCEMYQAHFLRYGHAMGDLIAFLQDLGFFTFVLGRGPALRPVDSTFAEAGGHELIAVRDVAAFAARTGWAFGDQSIPEAGR